MAAVQSLNGPREDGAVLVSTRRWPGRPQAVRHQLSVRIDGDGVDPAVVARDWLVQEGFGSDPTA